MSEDYFDNTIDAILDDDFPRFCFYLEKLQEEEIRNREVSFFFPNGSSRNKLLHFAVQKNRTKMVKKIIEYKGNVRDINNIWQTPLHIAASYGTDPDMIKILVKNGAKTDVRDRFGDTPLIIAVKNLNFPIAKALVANGANVTERNIYSLEQPVAIAIEKRDIELMDLLINNGAKLKYNVNAYGRTLMHHAAQYGNLEILINLIGRGGDIRAVDYNGETLLHAAAAGNKIEIIAFLVKKMGLDLTAENRFGEKAIDIAYSNRCSDAVMVILDFYKLKEMSKAIEDFEKRAMKKVKERKNDI